MKSKLLKKVIALAISTVTLMGIMTVGVSAEWRKDNNGWWYSTGKSYSISWKLIEGKWYYFNQNGYMKTGWIKDGDKWYFLSTSGDMKTGWIQDEGKWYFLSENGNMETGWIKDRDKWYFLNSSGEMERDTSINGYKLNSDGVWIDNKITTKSSVSFADDFEADLDKTAWYLEIPNKTSLQISDKYHESGSHALRIELNKSDKIVSNSKRAEIRIEQNNPINDRGPLGEYTYTFYTMLPNGSDEDYKNDPESSEIIAQWHNQPDTNEGWTSPPLSLATYNGRYVIQRCWDDAAITTNEQMIKKGNTASADLGSYIEDKGKWVQWKFHVKWGWSSTQNPILEVYKNGTQVLNCNGLPNTTNDKLGVIMKLGIYKWSWAQDSDPSILTKRVIYYDNVSIS